MREVRDESQTESADEMREAKRVGVGNYLNVHVAPALVLLPPATAAKKHVKRGAAATCGRHRKLL